MILQLKERITEDHARELARNFDAQYLVSFGHKTLVTTSGMKDVPGPLLTLIDRAFEFPNDMQLSARSYTDGKTREVPIGNEVVIGGSTNHCVVMTGPCSVESKEQILQSAELCKNLDIKVLRGGAYKPRTSPYSFQGLGRKGLELLAEMREQYGLAIISEVRDATHIEDVIELADVIQIGAKAMYDQGILRRCGATNKTVLLKRGFGSTLQEFVQAAEFILSGGNEKVILCERGIRTFETKTRFTLDLCGVAYLKEHTNLPIVLDPSHAMGYRYGVADLARACTAMGIDGLLIEAHPNPRIAKSDSAQQLDHDAFTALYHSLKPIAEAVGRKII